MFFSSKYWRTGKTYEVVLQSCVVSNDGSSLGLGEAIVPPAQKSLAPPQTFYIGNIAWCMFIYTFTRMGSGYVDLFQEVLLNLISH